MQEPDASPWGLMLLLGLLLLSYPLMALFNHRMPIFGVPMILLYGFGVWLGLILLSLLYRPRE